MKDFLVKVNQYRGGESVLGSYHTESEANHAAAQLNLRYQSDNHFVERFDPEKLVGWTATVDLTDKDLFPKW